MTKLKNKYKNAHDIDFFKDLKSTTSPKCAVVLPYLIMLMPIISWLLLTLGEMIFHIDIFMFHMNMLPLLLVAFTIVCVFLVLDLPAFFIKKDTPPFNAIIKEKITHTPEVVLLCLTFLWMLIASFFADNFPTPFKIYINFIDGLYLQEGILYFVAYFVIFICAVKQRDGNIQKHILSAFLVSSTLICLTTLVFNHNELIISSQNNTNWANGFVNSNHLGYVLCLATALLGICFCLSKKWKWQTLFISLLTLHLLVMMFNDTLGCNLAIFIGFILLPIICSIKKHKFDYLSFVPLVLLIAVSFICIPIAPKVDSTYKSLLGQIWGVIKDFLQVTKDPLAEETKKAGTNRWELWLSAFEAIKKYPIFGDGQMIEKPHNEYLQICAHSGIPCLLLYLASLITLAVKSIKNFKNLSLLTLAELFTVLCYLISAFFGNTMPHTFPFFMVILGFTMCSLNEDIKRAKKEIDHKITEKLVTTGDIEPSTTIAETAKNA